MPNASVARDIENLTDAQRRGAACIECALPVDATTAVLLPHVVDGEGVRLFPCRHRECSVSPESVAFWAHVEGHADVPPCEACTADGASCAEGRRLLRAAFGAAVARPS